MTELTQSAFRARGGLPLGDRPRALVFGDVGGLPADHVDARRAFLPWEPPHLAVVAAADAAATAAADYDGFARCVPVVAVLSRPPAGSAEWSEARRTAFVRGFAAVYASDEASLALFPGAAAWPPPPDEWRRLAAAPSHAAYRELA